jgi:hypothetical protein
VEKIKVFPSGRQVAESKDDLSLLDNTTVEVVFSLTKIKTLRGGEAVQCEVKLTVVLDYYEAIETYSCIGILRSYRKLTVVLDYYEAIGNLQSYWTR